MSNINRNFIKFVQVAIQELISWRNPIFLLHQYWNTIFMWDTQYCVLCIGSSVFCFGHLVFYGTSNILYETPSFFLYRRNLFCNKTTKFLMYPPDFCMKNSAFLAHTKKQKTCILYRTPCSFAKSWQQNVG